jgi:hypothetical protein
LGSDDILLNSLHLLVRNFNEQNTVYYADVYYPTSHKLFGGEFSSYDLMTRQIPHQATFYCKEIFNYHKFDTSYISAADHVFNIVCYNDKRFKFQYLPILVAIYEDTSGYSTLKLDKKYLDDHLKIIKENFPVADYRCYRARLFFKRFERLVLRKAFRYMKEKAILSI